MELNREFVQEGHTSSVSSILVIDDEPEVAWIFSKILAPNNGCYKILSALCGEDGLTIVARQKLDVIFLDMRLPGMDGMETLRKIKALDPMVPVIMLTAVEDIASAVSAMKLGAYDYIPKPVPNERLRIIIDQAIETHKLKQQIDYLQRTQQRKVSALEQIVAVSPCMQEVVTSIRRVASHDIPVLLLGETGSGKEIAAMALHENSRRKNGPFVVADCSAFAETLIEGELFGHEKGAFTGAVDRQIGRFEQAHTGTLFLDEIGNIGLALQSKLLRALESKEIHRLGGKRPVPTDGRVIAATNLDLRRAVREGKFREDLYHRLNVVAITLPPLRSRREDLPLLAKQFLDNSNQAFEKNIKRFSADALRLMRNYSWPGNVRELQNVVRSAVVMADGDEIVPANLSKYLCSVVTEPLITIQSLGCLGLKIQTRSVVADVEKEMIIKVLRDTNGNKRKAAKVLNIDYKTLFNKMKKYDLGQEAEGRADA